MSLVKSVMSRLQRLPNAGLDTRIDYHLSLSISTDLCLSLLKPTLWFITYQVDDVTGQVCDVTFASDFKSQTCLDVAS